MLFSKDELFNLSSQIYVGRMYGDEAKLSIKKSL